MNYLPRKDVILKQLKISWLPLVLAISYAVYSYISTVDEERTIKVAINYFAAAFFFLMWLVGQYLRTSKQIDDSANYQDIQTGINDVKESVDKLHNFQLEKPDTSELVNPLLYGAKLAVEQGHVLAGLMQAGVAFEQAIINKVGVEGFYRGSRVPISKAIWSLKNIMDKSVVKELQIVWKLRNQLVHLSPEAAKELEASPDLIEYFEWAISELER